VQQDFNRYLLLGKREKSLDSSVFLSSCFSRLALSFSTQYTTTMSAEIADFQGFVLNWWEDSGTRFFAAGTNPPDVHLLPPVVTALTDIPYRNYGRGAPRGHLTERWASRLILPWRFIPWRPRAFDGRIGFHSTDVRTMRIMTDMTL
jgi:hypothetical protein